MNRDFFKRLRTACEAVDACPGSPGAQARLLVLVNQIRKENLEDMIFSHGIEEINAFCPQAHLADKIKQHLRLSMICKESPPFTGQSFLGACGGNVLEAPVSL